MLIAKCWGKKYWKIHTNRVEMYLFKKWNILNHIISEVRISDSILSIEKLLKIYNSNILDNLKVKRNMLLMLIN